LPRVDTARIPKARDRGGGQYVRGEPANGIPGAPAAEILMFAGDGVKAADEDGRIFLCNRAAEEIFGYAADEIRGRSIETLLAEPARGTHCHMSAGGPRPPALIERQRLVGQRKHGGEIPLQAALSRRKIEGHTVLIAIVRDATERKAERLLARELEHRPGHGSGPGRSYPARQPVARGLHQDLLRPPSGAGSRPFAADAALPKQRPAA
jgi:PAS domain S-box-containing protein